MYLIQPQDWFQTVEFKSSRACVETRNDDLPAKSRSQIGSDPAFTSTASFLSIYLAISKNKVRPPPRNLTAQWAGIDAKGWRPFGQRVLDGLRADADGVDLMLLDARRSAPDGDFASPSVRI